MLNLSIVPYDTSRIFQNDFQGWVRVWMENGRVEDKPKRKRSSGIRKRNKAKGEDLVASEIGKLGGVKINFETENESDLLEGKRR